MTRAPAAALSPPDLRAHAAFVDGPIVRIVYRPPCATETRELFPGPVTADGVAGVEPERVVKGLCRDLGVVPGLLTFEVDPTAKGQGGDRARCYVMIGDRDDGGSAPDLAGDEDVPVLAVAPAAPASADTRPRVAHVSGVSWAWLMVEARRLARLGWRPATPLPTDPETST